MARSESGRLTANAVTPETVDFVFPHGITIMKLPESDGTYPAQPIWYRLDGTNPTVGGSDSFVCIDAVFIPHPAGGGGGSGYSPTDADQSVQIRMISANDVNYQVEGNPLWKHA